MKKNGYIALFVVMAVVIIVVSIYWKDIRAHIAGKCQDAERERLKAELEAEKKRVAQLTKSSDEMTKVLEEIIENNEIGRRTQELIDETHRRALKGDGTDEVEAEAETEDVDTVDEAIDTLGSIRTDKMLAEFYKNMAGKYGNERFNPLNQYVEKSLTGGFISEKQKQLAEKLKK